MELEPWEKELRDRPWGKPVKVKLSKDPMCVYSLRLTPRQLTHISRAARGRGFRVSDFIRRAALDAANDTSPTSSTVIVEMSPT